MSQNLIYWSNKSQVYAEESATHGKIVSKRLATENPSPKAIKQFYNEYNILKDIEIKGVRKVFNKSKKSNKHALSLEFIDGVTLEQFLKTSPSIEDILTVFIALSRIAQDIHDLSIIHRDFSSTNILIIPDTLEVFLIDFAIASKINIRIKNLGNPQKLEGTLNYMAPEQTGRVNRSIDQRTDIYSIGALLYEALTGQLPFKYADPLEMVHAHLAIKAEPPNFLNKNIPQVLSDIVLRLLEKNAEKRYQSATGLKYDLERCLMCQKKGTPFNFIIGEQDYKSRFKIVQKLYGRNVETKQLLDQFKYVTSGEKRLMLVSGISGTGKSALVAELYKPLTEKATYFVDGKFDQYQAAVPYSAVLKAMNKYIDLLLTEDTIKLNQISRIIQEAVADEGKVLTNVLPKLSLIIGRQEDITELNGEESKNRFKYLFMKFLRSCCTSENPMILFIDDLQWADSASIDLLNAILSDNKLKYFFCIFAYRNNEVNASHPFSLMIKGLQEEDLHMDHIHLENLRYEDVNQLVYEALSLDSEETQELSKIIFEKTQGNAFYVNEFFKSIYEKGFLKYQSSDHRWHWSIQELQKLKITENVVDFMANRIQNSNAQLKELLKTGSCIGNEFDLRTLSKLTNYADEEKKKLLQLAIKEGWLYEEEDSYAFSHDRIQQAVYSLLSQEERKKIHFELGCYLSENNTHEQNEALLFDLTNHLNLASSLVTDTKRKADLIQYNFQACTKAKENSAFQLAYDYAKNGLTLLEESDSSNSPELKISFHKEAAELAYLNAEFELMDHHIEEVIIHTDNELDKIEVNIIKINSYKSKNQLKEAIETGLEVLETLGESFPKKPGPQHIMPRLLSTMFKLRNCSKEDILKLEATTDPAMEAAMHILSKIAPSSYWYIPNLFPLIILRIVNLSLKYGTNPVSAFGFSAYGVIQVGVLGNSKSGHKYGEIGLELLDKYDAKEWVTQVYTAVYGLIFIWGDHVDTTLGPLLESYHIGLETGAIEFSCINANLYCINAFLIGKRLKTLEKETADFSATFKMYKQGINHLYNEVYHQAMLNLMEAKEDPVLLVGSAFNEIEMFKSGIEQNNRTGTFYIFFLKLILSNYFNVSKQAWEYAQKASPLLDAVLAKLELANFALHAGIAAANYYKICGQSEKSKALKTLKKNLNKLKKWAKSSKENYLHKYHILKAEFNIIKGNDLEVRNHYDNAIQLASNHHYIHQEALASERAGTYYLSQNNNFLAEYYIKYAYKTYRFWGANSKLNDLGKRYPEFVAEYHFNNKDNSGISISTSENKIDLDLITLAKASTAISENIVLEKLIKEMVSIVSQNVGANYAIFILKEDNQLSIQSIFENNKLMGSAELKSNNYQDFENLPKSIINYVIRTSSYINISNLNLDRNFYSDHYFKNNKPSSILAYPISHKQNIVGIIYLENQNIINSFSQKNIDLLNLLSGQIAVSLENAILYDSLEAKVEERTSELNQEKKRTDELLLNILPEKTALELKIYGKTKPRRHNEVTVIFTDFINFSKLSEKLTPEELVEQISVYFEAFDQIMKKYKIEKIKTIGDAYMAVSGLPTSNKDHAINAINAAFEIRTKLLSIKEERKSNGALYFDIRIGLSSGPVVAGVVGLHKFAYDVWGDTVNTAARMESNSEASKINISENTYKLIKGYFKCEHRGKIMAKNKGEIDMYFVDPL